MKIASKLPIIQCVAKLVGINQEGFLVPKVFKFGVLPEGTMKEFGLSDQLLPLLDTLASTFSYPTFNFKTVNDFKTNCLGFLAFDGEYPAVSSGEKYLPSFIPCACTAKIKDIEVRYDRIIYNNREYNHLLPSYNYYENSKFQRLVNELNDLKMLALPLNFPLTNLKNLIGFTNPSWAEVKPLEFFLEESPDNLNNYVMIRIDDGKIVTWDAVMSDPKLRLELEMQDYWLWQTACTTQPHLEHINLYWEFGMNYPLLFDRRTDTLIPTFIIDE